ncbi:MAG: hypothetical protein ACLUOF_08905 [Ruminococcus sp.]
MANTFQLEILASDRPFYVGPAEQLVFPTVDGLMAFCPDTSPWSRSSAREN